MRKQAFLYICLKKYLYNFFTFSSKVLYLYFVFKKKFREGIVPWLKIIVSGVLPILQYIRWQKRTVYPITYGSINIGNNFINFSWNFMAFRCLSIVYTLSIKKSLTEFSDSDEPPLVISDILLTNFIFRKQRHAVNMTSRL